jgi:hypothetical protein
VSGLFLLQPWGLLALAGLAGVAAVYLFYRRFRRVRVTGLFLWEAPAVASRAGRRLSRPTATRSLVLDVLSAALLALAVAVPAFRSRTAGTVAVVLDGGLSMRAGENYLRVREQAGSLTSGRPALVLLAGARPQRLALPDDGPAAAARALEGYDPFEPRVRLQHAVATACELLGGRGTVHVFTSRELKVSVPPGSEVHLHRLAGRKSNLAFVEATRARRGPGPERLTLTIANFSGGRARPRLEVLAGESSLRDGPLDLPPGGRVQVVLDLPPAAGEVRARLRGEADALAADSDLALVPEPSRTVTCRVEVSDPKRAAPLRRALRAAGARPVAAGEHLLVTDRARSSGSLLTVALHDFKEGKIFAGPFVADLADPLCRDLDLSGVYWPCDPKVRPVGADLPLVSCGGTGLYFFAGPRRLVLNLDPARGNVTRCDAWPVMFANLVDCVRPTLPGLRRANYLPGDPLLFVPGERGGPDRLRGTELDVRLEGLAPALPSRPGRYELLRGKSRLAEVTVAALAPEESDLRKLAEGDEVERLRPAGEIEEAAGRLRLSWAPVLAALLLLLLNWWLDLREPRE